MAAILPIAVWGLLWLTLIRRGQDRRAAVITASLIWGTLLVAMTEGLSLFRLLSFPWVALAWGGALLIVFVVYRRTSSLDAPAHSLNESHSRFERALMIVVFLVLVATGITALIAPPSTWDSMTYHMTRVAFWAQNHSIGHYPTTNARQLTYQPFAEYTILHFYLLVGGDQLANLAQWLSMVGSLIVASVIARDLGVRREGQWWVAVCCALLPMGLLQSSSTQNDYVVTFWVLCLIALILRAAQQRLTLQVSFWMGLCIGLMLYTKATGYIFGLPLLIAFGLLCLWQWRIRFWQPLLLAGVLALAINAPLYIRNLQGFSSPFGASEAQTDNLNGVISVPAFLSNAVRGVAMHIMIAPNRLDQALGFRDRIQQGVESFHTLIGFSPDDPRTTFNKQPFTVPSWTMNEDLAGNPVQLLAFGLSLGIYAFTPSLRKNRWISFFLLLLLSDFVVFCLLMRWNVWLSRYQLTFFPLMTIFAGVVLERWRSGMALLLLIMLPLSLSTILLNDNRAWIGERSIFTLPREDQYFVAARQLGKDMRQASEMVKTVQCSQVGIGAGGDQWVYPFFAIFRNLDWPVRIELISETIDYPLGDFDPCALIVYDTFPLKSYTSVDEAAYTLQSSSPSLFRVYVREND